MSGSEVRMSGGREGRLILAAILLGIGLGGFIDGIVLHQLLQWHHMVSHLRPPDDLDALRLNTIADGLFHAVTWLVTGAGVAVLFAAGGEQRRQPGAASRFGGGLLIGWGLFDLVEGTISHHLLELHHVRPGPDELLYDLGFLGLGAALVAIGSFLVRRSRVNGSDGL